MNATAEISKTDATNIPDVITKELAVGRAANEKRRIVVSTNWLRLMGLEPGVRHDLLPIAGGGIEAVFNPSGTHKVYERRYKSRRNNPLESQLDIHSQSLLNECIPGYTERVHIEFRRGRVLIRPLVNRTFSIRRSLDGMVGKPAAFVAMTAGVDAKCLVENGFHIDSVLEYRPPEARDKHSLEETGALSAISQAGVHPRLLINEDITTVEMDRLKQLMVGAPPCAMMHISIQCDDYSPLKSTKARAASVDSLTTSVDLAYDALRVIETVQPAMVLIENVGGFASHPNSEMIRIKLRRWGYHVTDAILDARDYGGRTGRNRYYMVASVWPGFAMPQPQPRSTTPLWAEIERFLPDCRDVSHTNSVALGVETGRIRIIDKDSIWAPTVTKSQQRQTKDSIYIFHKGKYLLPSVELLAFLNGIEDFNFATCSETLASEIIGQSICTRMHGALARAAVEHIYANTGNRKVVSIQKKDEVSAQNLHSQRIILPSQGSFNF
jgi:DNA (cytosine-5)-methyltransferase 1